MEKSEQTLKSYSPKEARSRGLAGQPSSSGQCSGHGLPLLSPYGGEKRRWPFLPSVTFLLSWKTSSSFLPKGLTHAVPFPQLMEGPHLGLCCAHVHQDQGPVEAET